MKRPLDVSALHAAGMEITRDQGVRLDCLTPNFANEKEFMAWLIRMAQRSGWLVYHPYDSRKSEPGWPDVFMCRGEVALAFECKTETGHVTDEQARWLLALRACGIEARVVRPADAEWIRAILEGKP